MAPSRPSPDALNGVVIGLLSSLGSALLIGFIFVLIYFFKYTNPGRIFLDRIGRPGEYDDEQAFAREEAEALETMDDMQRSEYLRAKGTSKHSRPSIQEQTGHAKLTRDQHSSRPTLPSPCRPISHFHSIWPYKRRVFRLGSSSRNSRLQTASSKAAQRSSSSTPSVPS